MGLKEAKTGWASALSNKGWLYVGIPLSVLAASVWAVIFLALYVGLAGQEIPAEIGGETRQVTRVTVPSALEGVEPEFVCQFATEKYFTEVFGVRHYTAILGEHRIDWTPGDASIAFSQGTTSIYPLIDGLGGLAECLTADAQYKPPF